MWDIILNVRAGSTFFCWGLGILRLGALCWFRAFLQAAVLPTDFRISGVTPGGSIPIWVPAEVSPEAPA